MPYRVALSEQARDHIRALTARRRAIVLDAIEEQLTHQPTVQTRNRKPAEESRLGPWVLRIGELRVYYDVVDEPEAVVTILAVGTKERNILRAGNEVFDLTGHTSDEEHQP